MERVYLKTFKESMKKLLLAIMPIGMVSSCTEPTVTKQRTAIVTHEGANPMDVIFIEGCEYLEYSSGHRYSLCHKGNCKNPIHPENKGDK
jgi:hypothetical protein